MVTAHVNSASNICSLILPYDFTDERRAMTACTVADEEKTDRDALKFNRNLLSAAAWMGNERLVARLLGDGFNWFRAS